MRLIDADKLKALFENDDDIFKSQDIRHIIDVGTETVNDVVPCKDCKHWHCFHTDDHAERFGECLLLKKWNSECMGISTNENWFCADGERKEEKE